MASQNDLDLSQISNEDLESLAIAVETFYKKDTFVKTQLAYAWERNHLFLDGKQWIVFDGSREIGGMWRPLQLSKDNEYIPRPVTNYIYDGYQTLKSYLIKNKPRSQVFPNTELYKDKQAAKLATMCLECNWERLKEQDNYEIAAASLLAYGTVFKKDYWDNTSLMRAKVPVMEEVPETDPMTGLPTGQMGVREKTDPVTGDVVFEELPLGDVNTAIIEPYRMILDPLAVNIHNARWIGEYSIQPLSWIMSMYDKDPLENPGYTGLARSVKAETNLNSSLRRFLDLRTSSGVKGTAVAVDGQGDTNVENTAVVKEIYVAPTAEYPKGRLVVVANNVTVYAGESPYEGPELGDWHPYSECRWELVPGRYFGKSPIDDAVDLQKQINSIDAVIILTRKTMAIPQKLIPNGSGITPGSWTGRPGQNMFYKETGGAKPEILPAAGVDPQVFAERQQKVKDLMQIMGAIDILKGDRPPGVTATSALNLLYEVGTGKIWPALDRWKAFVECSQKKQLKLIAKKYKEPRPEFIALLRAKNKEFSPEAINSFLGSDLYDNCNVVVEAGSNVPKLKSAHQAMLLELAQANALGLDQPSNRSEFHQQLGITGFDSDIGPDKRRAEYENDLMDDIMSGTGMRPVVLAVDKDALHVEVHSNRMKEPSFMLLPAPVQQAYMLHMQEHEQAQSQKMQAMMLQQQALAGAGPAGPPPQQQKEPGHVTHPMAPRSAAPTRTLNTKAVKNALNGDLLTPATLGMGSRGST